MGDANPVWGGDVPWCSDTRCSRWSDGVCSITQKHSTNEVCEPEIARVVRERLDAIRERDEARTQLTAAIEEYEEGRRVAVVMEVQLRETIEGLIAERDAARRERDEARAQVAALRELLAEARASLDRVATAYGRSLHPALIEQVKRIDAALGEEVSRAR